MGKRNQNTFNSETARQAGKNRKGIKHKNTRLRKILGIANIEDLKYDILIVWENLIKYGTKTEKRFAAKELSKYLFPQKREHSGEMNDKIKVEINYGNDPNNES